MKTVERWLKENFERDIRSMDGSCENVAYVPKHDNTPPCPDEADERGPMAWERLLISVAVIVGTSAATLQVLLA